MTTLRLTPFQIKKIDEAGRKGQAKYVDIEDTNLSGVIAVTFHVNRTKRTYLMDKDGKSHELVKKARKK